MGCKQQTVSKLFELPTPVMGAMLLHYLEHFQESVFIFWFYFLKPIQTLRTSGSSLMRDWRNTATQNSWPENLLHEQIYLFSYTHTFYQLMIWVVYSKASQTKPTLPGESEQVPLYSFPYLSSLQEHQGYLLPLIWHQEAFSIQIWQSTMQARKLLSSGALNRCTSLIN